MPKVAIREKENTIQAKQFGWLKYFQPTRHLRQYLMLESLLRSPDNHITQRDIALTSGISPSVVNQYLGDFFAEKLIDRAPINQRDFSYTLTSYGKAQQREMMIEYIRETFQLFSASKMELSKILQGYQSKYRICDVIFYSAGVVTELLLHALQETSMKLLAIVDDDHKKQDRTLFGYPVIHAKEIIRYRPDAVIVTTFRYRQEIHERISKLHLKKSGIRIIDF